MIMLVTAICFCLYALVTYYWRSRRIRLRLDGPYDDLVGPALLAVALVGGFGISISLHLLDRAALA